MKKFIVSLTAGLITGSALVALAQPANFSGSALNPATRTQSDVATAVANTAILQDQSKIPDQDNRVGYVSVLFDVANQGGTGSIDIGPVVPDGTVVVGGQAHVVTAVAPAAAATNTAISLQASGDLKAAATSIGSAGLVSLIPSTASVSIPSGTNASTASVTFSPIVVTGENSRITFDFGSDATQGVVLVHLDLIKVQ
jgi:hypothetical protein